jgi:hypothetical protein
VNANSGGGFSPWSFRGLDDRGVAEGARLTEAQKTRAGLALELFTNSESGMEAASSALGQSPRLNGPDSDRIRAFSPACMKERGAQPARLYGQPILIKARSAGMSSVQPAHRMRR